jgi:cyclopropane fatty-acyl-phospholipid synthase-like methyltransferase
VIWRTRTLLNEIYDKDYFENGVEIGKSGYTNYRWLPERAYREVRAVINLLGIEPGQTVLDFGCAKGYWVRAFREYGINAYGCDTSDYALSNADDNVKDFLTKDIPDRKFDFIVSRNTFEHIDAEELAIILKKFATLTDVLFFTVPLIDPQTRDYVMQMPDITHKIRWTNSQWLTFVEDCGWIHTNAFPFIDGLHDNLRQYPNSIGYYLVKQCK